MTKAPKHNTPPTLTIDLDDQFAWMRVIVGLAWGGEPRKTAQALATLSAEGLGVLQELKQLPLAVPNLHALARMLDLPVNQLVRMPGATTFYGTYFTNPAHTAIELNQKVFNPAGHYGAVAAAPGWDRLLVDMQRALNGGAYLAGVLLVLVATLAERHRDLPASLNRAIAVLEAGSARGVHKPPSGRTLIAVWKKWRHLAPLWAAYALELRQGRALGLSMDAAGLEAAYDLTRVRRILGTAKWFQSFAEAHVSKRAKGRLLRPGEALQIIADVDEVKPDLDPLAAEDLAAAKAHRVP